MKKNNFDLIRPFFDSEVPDAMKKLASETGFLKVAKFLMPDFPADKIAEQFKQVKSVRDFQQGFVSLLVKTLIKRSTEQFTFEGLENLDPKESYLYISNHRDIVLDSAFLNEIIMSNGFETTEIAIGSNLLILPWITLLVKLNKTFIVKRNVPWREMYDYSQLLSHYIRHTLVDKKNSVWIAQREGRTKNGDDRTQVSLLKMFNISGEDDFATNFKQLKIVPVSISYQYEPCDIDKVKETYAKANSSRFKKTRMDDLFSMGKGMIANKGHVHFTFGKPILDDLDIINNLENKNEQFEHLGKLIDKQIHLGYKLFPANYAAADMLFGTNEYSENYTLPEKQKFVDYMMGHISKTDGDKKELERRFLEIYAYPVKNKKEAAV